MVGFASYFLVFTPEGARLLSTEGRKELFTRIDLLVSSAGVFGPVLFVLIYAAGVLALPATPFSIAGAYIFGKYLGTLVNVFGASLGAMISFCLGRYFLRDFAKERLVGKLRELDTKAGEHGFSIIFYLRILWFPFIVLNYAAGATNVSFFVTTAIIQALQLFEQVYVLIPTEPPWCTKQFHIFFGALLISKGIPKI